MEFALSTEAALEIMQLLLMGSHDGFERILQLTGVHVIRLLSQASKEINPFQV